MPSVKKHLVMEGLLVVRLIVGMVDGTLLADIRGRREHGEGVLFLGHRSLIPFPKGRVQVPANLRRVHAFQLSRPSGESSKMVPTL